MFRIGQGFDVHQLVEGRPLIIGGIEIPYEKGCSAILMQTYCCIPSLTPASGLLEKATSASIFLILILSSRMQILSNYFSMSGGS